MNIRRFLFAGLDFVADDRGRWYFLEANDDPAGMLLCDRLQQKAGMFYSGSGVVSSLAKNLTELANGRSILFLLPDCYIIDSPSHSSRTVKASVPENIDARITRTVSEFNSLSMRLRKQGQKAMIIDRNVLVENQKQIITSNGKTEEIGVLYRRSQRFPLCLPQYPCVNDLRLRNICGDKFTTLSVLNSHGIRIPATAGVNANCKSDFRSLDYIIRKPRWGSGSYNVIRLPEWNGNLGDLDSQYLFQEWIKPATIKNGNFGYHFDVRVYLVSGEVCGAYVRRAAAPSQGIADNNPLSWLTTTGPSLSIPEATLNSSFRLDNASLEKLFNISRQIVQILDKKAEAEVYADQVEKTPSFSDLFDPDCSGIKDVVLKEGDNDGYT